MKEVKQNEIFKLKDLFDEIIKETNVEMTGAEAVVKFDRAYNGNYLRIFTDNVDDPKHCLVVAHYPGFVHSGFICVVQVIYSKPRHRNQISLNQMRALYREYAKKNNCEYIIGSAWKYKGARGIDSIWIDDGFEPQETVYVLKL